MMDLGFSPGDRLVLIDASSFVHRAYHVHKGLARADGFPTGAIYGFSSMMLDLIPRYFESDPPTHIAAVFDYSGRTFRNDIYPEYKAHRSAPDEALRQQFPHVRRACEAFGIPAIERQGFEADDILAAYARQAPEEGARVVIVSQDKDLFQLIDDPHVVMLDTMKGVWIDRSHVEAKLGVPPKFVADYLAIVGDASDNVPGVPGIGAKGAADLVVSMGNVETMAQFIQNVPVKYREKFRAGVESALLSKRLVELSHDVPDLPYAEGLAMLPIPMPEARAFCAEFEMNAILEKIGG